MLNNSNLKKIDQIINAVENYRFEISDKQKIVLYLRDIFKTRADRFLIESIFSKEIIDAIDITSSKYSSLDERIFFVHGSRNKLAINSEIFYIEEIVKNSEIGDELGMQELDTIITHLKVADLMNDIRKGFSKEIKKAVSKKNRKKKGLGLFETAVCDSYQPKYMTHTYEIVQFKKTKGAL